MEWQALHYTRRATESRNPFRYRFLGRRPLVPVGAGEGGMWRGDPCGRPSSFHRQRRGRPQGSPPFPSPPPPLRGRSRFPCLFAKNLYLRVVPDPGLRGFQPILVASLGNTATAACALVVTCESTAFCFVPVRPCWNVNAANKAAANRAMPEMRNDPCSASTNA